MKEIQFFWIWGYLCVIFFSLIQNGAFQRDLMQLIMLPVNWCRKYAIWFEQLDYMGYSTGEVVLNEYFKCCDYGGNCRGCISCMGRN